MSLNIQGRLVDHLWSDSRARIVADVRIGLGYTAVKLDSGHGGVAWTPRLESHGCTHCQEAGTLAGRAASALLQGLADDRSSLTRAIGLATANALLAGLPGPEAVREDVVSILCLRPQERVVMVGYFGPLIPTLKATGCQLDIIELSPHPGETLTPEQGWAALAACDVAILTGTSLVNGTCDDLLAGIRKPRSVVLLGPSAPLCPAAFKGTPVTHLAGSRVHSADAVLRIVSEGGGTMLLKKHMDFETVPVEPAMA